MVNCVKTFCLTFRKGHLEWRWPWESRICAVDMSTAGDFKSGQLITPNPAPIICSCVSRILYRNMILLLVVTSLGLKGKLSAEIDPGTSITSPMDGMWETREVFHRSQLGLWYSCLCLGFNAIPVSVFVLTLSLSLSVLILTLNSLLL